MLTEPVAGAHSISRLSQRTRVLVLLMVVQSALGLTFSDQYRDREWIRTMWLGNDWVTLLVAVPLLILGSVAANRGRARGHLLWIGVTAYGDCCLTRPRRRAWRSPGVDHSADIHDGCDVGRLCERSR